MSEEASEAIPPKKDGVSSEEKKRRIAELRVLQEPVFLAINVVDPQYMPHMCFPEGGEKVISVFTNELQTGNDIYTEFASKDYISEDHDRVLWKWPYNPHWETEYGTRQTKTSLIHYIPVSELTKIATNGVVIDYKVENEDIVPIIEPKIDLGAMLKKKDPLDMPVTMQAGGFMDIPLKDLTLRQIREILNKLT